METHLYILKTIIENSVTLEEHIENNPTPPEGYWGHIYLTYCEPEDKYYLGKKQYYNTITKKLGKKEIAALPKTRGRQKLTKQVITESDWKTYYGSHPIVKKWVTNYKPEEITRSIVKLCKNKKELTYFENKYLYSLGVIEPGSKFINDNISGTIFTKDFL